MRPVMRLALGLVVLALVFVAVAFALPNQITVSRSVVINAPEAVVFPYLNNLHAFKDWSPWAERDPNVRVSYSGPETGKGASLSWASEQASVGRGSMQIAESDPNRRIDLAVDYNGLEGTAFYTIAPAGSGSKVTWGFGHETGTSPIKRWRGTHARWFCRLGVPGRSREPEREDRGGTATDRTCCDSAAGCATGRKRCAAACGTAAGRTGTGGRGAATARAEEAATQALGRA